MQFRSNLDKINITFGLLRTAEIFDEEPRRGAEKDDPEGSRYIVITDTLAREFAEFMRRAAQEVNRLNEEIDDMY